MIETISILAAFKHIRILGPTFDGNRIKILDFIF